MMYLCCCNHRDVFLVLALSLRNSERLCFLSMAFLITLILRYFFDFFADKLSDGNRRKRQGRIIFVVKISKRLSQDFCHRFKGDKPKETQKIYDKWYVTKLLVFFVKIHYMKLKNRCFKKTICTTSPPLRKNLKFKLCVRILISCIEE